MASRRPAKKTKNLFEDGLIEDAAKLRGVHLGQLGYYGDEEDDDGYEEPFYASEEERAADERNARLLAGCIWRCSGQLVAGLFDDLYDLRRLEHRFSDAERLAFIRNESQVLHRLPPAYAAHYTVEFAQRFLVVAADLTAQLAGSWISPSCLAQEIAVSCLAGMIEDYADTQGLDLGRDISGTLFEGLLEDTDHLFLYDASDEDGGALERSLEEALKMTGAASMSFDDWFMPFNE